ncbi:MAG: site-specific tyrosine recombinase XerD [Actinobacteria bacterium]|nr:site-specific tyrosine recombinase XerD [Actinomycetota bacterium]
MIFETAKTNYLNHLRIERGLSENTLGSYARDLTKFADFLHLRKLNFDSLSDEDITNFQVVLKQSKLSPTSINRTFSALKGFYKYCSLEHEVRNPISDVANAKIARKLPKALTIDEIESLLGAAKREGDASSLRDVAILEILYSTGARVSEVIGLNTGDVSVNRVENQEVSTIKLRGKGSKERIVPLGKYAVRALDDYQIRTRPLLSSKNSRSESALFLNNRGSRLSRQSAWNIVLEAAKVVGLEGKVSPHVFRHSYATHLLDGGADIRVVQELLGHSSVTTTQIYTLITIDKVRESYSAAHPRAR